MRFKEGQTPRTRVKNLVMPLRYEDETVPISDAFTKQVRQALNNLRDKQGVTVRFIGYTDDAPLTGRDESVYGNALVVVEGKGASRRIGHAKNPGIACFGDRKRRSRELPSDCLQRNRAGTGDQSSHRGGILVRRSSSGFIGRAATVPGRCRGNGDQGLRSSLGQHPGYRARERSADHSAGLRGESASRT